MIDTAIVGTKFCLKIGLVTVNISSILESRHEPPATVVGQYVSSILFKLDRTAAAALLI